MRRRRRSSGSSGRPRDRARDRGQRRPRPCRRRRSARAACIDRGSPRARAAQRAARAVAARAGWIHPRCRRRPGANVSLPPQATSPLRRGQPASNTKSSLAARAFATANRELAGATLIGSPVGCAHESPSRKLHQSSTRSRNTQCFPRARPASSRPAACHMPGADVTCCVPACTSRTRRSITPRRRPVVPDRR
jgi:hypothetical protein